LSPNFQATEKSRKILDAHIFSSKHTPLLALSANSNLVIYYHLFAHTRALHHASI